jgi:hypothetical protein
MVPTKLEVFGIIVEPEDIPSKKIIFEVNELILKVFLPMNITSKPRSFGSFMRTISQMLLGTIGLFLEKWSVSTEIASLTPSPFKLQRRLI